MQLRLRQICLVAEKLAPAVDDLCAVFGIEVCYRDPAVGKWGLENALMPIGNGLLEVVAPTRDGTAAGRYLERRKGDGGYMVILQAKEIDSYRERIAKIGVRLIAEPNYGEYIGMQLHPRDTGGAILSIDWNEGDPDDPASPWHPAGPNWQRARRTERVMHMAAAELQGDEPEALAVKWGEILGLKLHRDGGAPVLQLDDGVIRFVRIRDGRGEGLGMLDLKTGKDRAEIIATAEQRGCPVDGDVVTVCGTRFRLV